MDEKKITCTHCGAEIDTNHIFCPYCGSKVVTGSDEPEREEFEEPVKPDDTNSSYQVYAIPTETYKKKKSHKGCLVLILIILLGIGGFAGYQYYEYKEYEKAEQAQYAAAEFAYDVINDALLLEELGMDIADSWHGTLFNNKYPSVDDAFAAVFEEHSEDVSTIYSDYTEITKKYKKALELTENAGMSALSDGVRDLYNKYIELYNATINFNCSYSEFVDNFNAADMNLGVSFQTIAALLEDWTESK